MNQEIKKLWVEALRSGKYKQGIHGLNYKNQNEKECFCVLGVLCELAYEKRICTKEHKKNYVFEKIEFLYDSCIATLPNSVKMFAGITNEDMKKIYQIIEYNDSGKSFEFIADKIEIQF